MKYFDESIEESLPSISELSPFYPMRKYNKITPDLRHEFLDKILF